MISIIPVRSGSRRVPNKNIRPFGKSNLLIHKINQLKNVPQIDDIIVSSDSDEYLEIARNEGVNIQKRPLIYSDEKSVPFGETVKWICENIKGDDVLWSTVTSPLTVDTTYSLAIYDYYNNVPKNNDSLVSFEILKYYLWNDNGPINYEFGIKHTLSQDLPNIYHPTNGIFIAPRLKMIEWKYFHGQNPYKFIIDKKQAIDIDDEIDFKIAELLLNT